MATNVGFGCYLESSNSYNGRFILNLNVHLWVILLLVLFYPVVETLMFMSVIAGNVKNKHAKQVVLQGPLTLVKKSQIKVAKET